MITWIASFDIGKKNFAFCIEEVEIEDGDKVKNIPKTKRYNLDGTCTLEFQELLNTNVYSKGRIILAKNIDLTGNTNLKQYLDPEIFINMYAVLSQYNDYWEKCSRVLIEQQMNFKNKQNSMALKLGQHCYSYFIFIHFKHQTIVEFPAYHKTKVLGAVKKLTKPQRKKWAIQIATTILTERGELDVLKEYKKKDDISDCILQLQAYKYLCFIDKVL